MAITENDIIQNAPAIAALINAGGVTIGDLPEAAGPLGSADFLHTQIAGIDKYIQVGNAGLGGGDFILQVPAGAWDRPSTNYAEWDRDSGTNGNISRELYDDTTEEFLEIQFILPGSISGSATFDVWGFPSTWVTGKNIELKVYHSAIASGESWDGAYSSKESGDLALNTTGQDVIDKLTFSDTITNLGWTAGDHVRLKLSRIAASANNLVGDWGMTNFKLTVPS